MLLFGLFMPATPLPAPDFALLFAALPDACAVLAPDGRVLALNTALADLLAPAPAAALVGQPLAELRDALAAAGHGPAEAGAWAAGLRAAQAPASATTGHGPAAEPLTGPGPYAATLQPVRAPGAGGAPATELRCILVRLQRVAVPLPAADRVCQPLAEAEADPALRHLLASLPAISFISDQHGRVHYLSPQWYAYTGTGPADDLDQAWQAHLHPDDRSRVHAEYAAALAGGRPWRYELRLRRHDGAYRWFVSEGVPEPLADAAAAGRPRRWYGSDLDVHDLWEARHRLDTKDQHLAQILSQTPALIATTEGHRHRFTYTNSGFDALVSFRAQTGQTMAECLPEMVDQGFALLLDMVYYTGEPYLGLETLFEVREPATGRSRQHYLDLTYQALRDGHGRINGVLAFGTDVTAQVLARRQAEVLQREMHAADERLRRQTEILPIITFTTDAEGRTLYMSPQWYAYTGQHPGGPWADVDARWPEVLHPDDQLSAGQEIQESIAQARLGRVEVRLRRFDGAYRWFLTEAVPETDAAGHLRRRYGFMLDVHELREAQGRLEAKDQQLSRILGQTPALIASVHGPEHRLSFLNASYDAHTGHRARLGQPVAACFPEVVEQGLVALLDEVYRSGETFVGRETPVSLRHPTTGEWQKTYFDFTYQPLRDEAGQVAGVLGFAVDVTAQVRARRQAEALQREVHAADERLRHQAEVLPIITFSTDAEGRTTFMSPQWYAYTGQPPGGPWADVDAWWPEALHPDDRARAAQEIQASIAQARLGRVEVRLRGADGRYRAFLTEAVAEVDAAGQLVQRHGFMLDVHELREAQGRLEAKDQQLSRILGQAPAAIATAEGPEHRFAFSNPAYDALVGHRVRLGAPVRDCLPEAVEQGFVALLDEVYRSGETFVGREVPFDLPDPATGQPRPLHLDFTYQALRDGAGRVTGLLAFVVDVTERVRARQQAEALSAEMRRRDEQVRAITAAVPVFIFNFDPAGAITYTSPYFYEYTGLDPARPLAESWDVLPADDRAAVSRLTEAAMAAGDPWQATFRVRRHDGELRWFQTKAQPYPGAAGQLAGFSAATIEIHDLQARTEELARSRADFAALADNMAQLAWMADPSGHIFWYNQQWYDYTGSTLEEMQGWGWMRVHDPAQVQAVNERYLAAIAAGQSWEDTFPLRRHDGEYRWFLSRARPIRDPATGAVLRWFGTNTDVTELRRLQEQVSANEEELRIQAESIPQQVWTARPDGTVDFYNHRTAAYLGEPVEKHGAAHWLSFVHPDDRPTMQSRWEVAIATQRYYEAEFRLRRYDGQYRWFLGQAQARRAPGGQVLKWYGTNTDIQQQRQLTQELGRREEQFRFLAESVPQMVWTSLGAGGNDYVNQRWFDYTGQDPAATGGRADWAAAIHPDDLNSTDRRWAQCVATGEFFEIEYRFRRHDGEYRWFLGQGRAQRHADGRVIKWFGTCTDIDDQKQSRQQLEEQNARLRRTNEDLDNFVYTASHDLKQPINNMAGIFEELTRTAYFRDPDAIKLITYFERALAQIFRTIDELGAIVQGQRQEQEVAAEDVALAPLVAEILGSFQDQVTQTGATFELDFATCPTVPFVRPNLQSLFFNLIGNSLKYAAPDRPPRIRLSSTPDAVTGRPVLTVQDNGLGIDLERFGDQLFQLFRRFHAHADGTGVGLYLVNRIVQSHGGRLEVASTVGEGTTFLIYL